MSENCKQDTEKPRFYQERLHSIDIVFMWNSLGDFPHYCTIFHTHFVYRTKFYAITNQFLHPSVRHTV